MIFYDGTAERAAQFAQDRDLNFPVLSDPSWTVFDRWNPARATPSTTLLGRGLRVHAIDTTWHTAMLEELLEE